MLILQCNLGLQSQSIELKNALSQVDILSGDTVFIELPRDFYSDGWQCDVDIRLRKILYGVAEAALLWYEKLRIFIYHGFVMSKLDICLFTYKTVIFVAYVDACIFWARSQSDTYNVMKSLKEDGNIYNWDQSKGESVSKFLGIDINTLDNGGFQFC